MKRPEMLERLKARLNHIKGGKPDTGEELYPNDEYLVWALLDEVEKAGMRPPCLPDQYCQALHDVYVYPNLNQWEEEVEQDQKVMDRVKKREEWSG